ncbi:MAG: hypothetical protein Q4C71_05960, partial [Microbacteriaceae bacterium]|nr:hypothetical protein [Microbacteriaceae bacterium]
CNLRFWRPLLYQLSHRPMCFSAILWHFWAQQSNYQFTSVKFTAFFWFCLTEFLFGRVFWAVWADFFWFFAGFARFWAGCFYFLWRKTPIIFGLFMAGWIGKELVF